MPSGTRRAVELTGNAGVISSILIGYLSSILRAVTDAENWNASNSYKFRLPALFKIRNYDRAEYI